MKSIKSCTSPNGGAQNPIPRLAYGRAERCGLFPMLRGRAKSPRPKPRAFSGFRGAALLAAIAILHLLAPPRASAQSVYIGNSLTVTDGAADGGAPLVILGEYNKAGPLAGSDLSLPTGVIQDVKFYGQNYAFTLYALTYAGPGPHTNEQAFEVVASQSFAASGQTLGIHTIAVTNFSVFGGNILAFAGRGPYYPQETNDNANSDATYQDPTNPTSGTATPPGGPGTVFNVGTYPDTNATYGYISDVFGNQGRTYGIGVDVLETNLYVPVYQVVQSGATAEQAAMLANYLNIPTNKLVLDNGCVTFIDTSNHIAVPSILATNSGKVVRLLDIATLTNLTLYATNLALNSASNALAFAGLTPQLATPAIHHASLSANVTNADGKPTFIHQYLNTMVHYTFSLPSGANILPLLGSGAKAIIDYGPTGNVTHLRYAARQLAPGPMVKIISPTEASNRVARRLGPVTAMNMTLAYGATAFDPPRYAPLTVTWNPTTMVPFYIFRASTTQTNPATGAVQSIPDTTAILATDDTNYVPSVSLSASTLGGTQVVATVAARGGTPPYFYLWSGTDPSVSTNTGPSVTYTPKTRVPSPTLRVSSLFPTNAVSVSWPYPSAGFVLQSTTNLLSGPWSAVISPIQTNPGANVVTLTASSRLFLRLALATNELPVSEAVSVLVTDANGVSVGTNLTLSLLGQVVNRSSSSNAIRPRGVLPGTYGEESPYYVSDLATATEKWRSAMNGNWNQVNGGSEIFDWTQLNSWPGDFAEPSPAGTLQAVQSSPAIGNSADAPFPIDLDADFPNWGINTASMVIYFGHCNAGMFSFTYPDFPLNGNAGYSLQLKEAGQDMWATYSYDMLWPYSINLQDSWGTYGPNDYLNWLAFYGCNTLQWNFNDPTETSGQEGGGVYANQAWGGAFNGLHLLLGYQSALSAGNGQNWDNTPGDFASLMLGNTGSGAQPIMTAWFVATEWDQPEGFNNFNCGQEGAGGWTFPDGCEFHVWPAAIGPFGPNVTTIFGTYPQMIGSFEYYASSASQGTTPAQNQANGFWYMNQQ